MCGCLCLCVCVYVCVYALRTISVDKILCYTDTTVILCCLHPHPHCSLSTSRCYGLWTQNSKSWHSCWPSAFLSVRATALTSISARTTSRTTGTRRCPTWNWTPPRPTPLWPKTWTRTCPMLVRACRHSIVKVFCFVLSVSCWAACRSCWVSVLCFYKWLSLCVLDCFVLLILDSCKVAMITVTLAIPLLQQWFPLKVRVLYKAKLSAIVGFIECWLKNILMQWDGIGCPCNRLKWLCAVHV